MKICYTYSESSSWNLLIKQKPRPDKLIWVIDVYLNINLGYYSPDRNCFRIYHGGLFCNSYQIISWMKSIRIEESKVISNVDYIGKPELPFSLAKLFNNTKIRI